MPEEPKSPKRRGPRQPTLHLGRLDIEGEFRPRESLEEIEARLKLADAEAEHAQWRDRLTTRAGLAAITIVGTSCLVVIFLPGDHPRGWATSTLSVIVGGIITYVFRAVKK